MAAPLRRPDNRPDPHSVPTRRSSDLQDDGRQPDRAVLRSAAGRRHDRRPRHPAVHAEIAPGSDQLHPAGHAAVSHVDLGDRKSTRLNSSHRTISYAVFCLKKKKTNKHLLYITNTIKANPSPYISTCTSATPYFLLPNAFFLTSLLLPRVALAPLLIS